MLHNIAYIYDINYGFQLFYSLKHWKWEYELQQNEKGTCVRSQIR